MMTNGISAMALRLLAAAIFSGAVVHQFPSALLTPMAWGAARVAEWTSPWLSHISPEVQQANIRFTGRISVNMVLGSGEPTPTIEGSWRSSGGKYLVLGVIVATVWAIPAGRRRWSALPFTLLAMILVGAIDLSLEMQRTALMTIGYEWLPALSFADMDINRDTFARIDRAYRALEWARSFQGGGGLFFMGVIAGWIGYAVPAFTRPSHGGPPR